MTFFVNFLDHVYYRWTRSIYRPIYIDCRPMHRPLCSDRLLVKYRSSIGQVSFMYRSCRSHVSVEYRWTKTISVNIFIGRQSTDISVDYRSIYWSTIGRLSTDISTDISVDYRSAIGRLSTDISTESTYSTQDPIFSNECPR